MKENLCFNNKLLNKKLISKALKLILIALTSLVIYVTCLLGYLLLGFKLNFITLYIITSTAMYPIILAYYYDKVLPISDWLLSFIGIEIYDNEIEDTLRDDITEKSSLFDKSIDFICSLLLEIIVSVPSVLIIFFAGLPLVLYSVMFD